MSNLVYISGAAMTQFGRSESSLDSLMVEAGRAALNDAGLDTVEALYLGVMNPAEFTGDSNLAALLADQLGLPGVPSSRVETASSTGAGVLEVAFYAVASGYVKRALVVAGEKMTHLPTAQTTRILARVIDKVERQYGASMPALAAMIARRYAYENGLGQEELARALAAVAIKNHANGSLNPLAQFRKAIAPENYLKSKMVADPLRIYDCAPITDGAAAVVLTTEPSKVCLTGIGHATDTLAVGRRGTLTSFNSTKQAAMKAYRMAQINPKEVDLAEVHDAFTIFEIIGTEDLGFFEPGQGCRAVLEGWTTLQGRLPVNSSGGLKARGHPVGASGLAQVVELVWQLRRQLPEARLIKDASIALAQSIGGLANNNFVTILKRADHRQVWQVDFEPDYAPELFPPRPTLELDSLRSGRGELLTWTVLHSPPEGFEPPLKMGYVRMADGAVILAHVDQDAFEELPAVGEKVSVDVSGEFFIFKPYDPSLVWRKPLDEIKKKIWGWWSYMEDAYSVAAAKAMGGRRKEAGRAETEEEEKTEKVA